MTPPLIVRQDHGAVTVLALNRPEKRNALSQALIGALTRNLNGLANARGVRAVVLTGTGDAFCAGMDLKEAFAPVDTEADEQRAIVEVQALGDLLDQVHAFPKPTIAAVNGPALAGGAGLAMACDFVVMSETAQIGYPEVLRGLVPAMVLHELVRLVGQRRARELLLAGQPVASNQAVLWGLANEVVPPERLMERTLAVGGSLALGSPHAQSTIKQLLDEATARPASLREAAAVTAAVRTSGDAQEGIAAFFEKRPPRWS